jgi:hypothetical protein
VSRTGAAVLFLLLASCAGAAARRGGDWVLLEPSEWRAGDKPLPGTNLAEGAINAHKTGAGLVHHPAVFGDFIFACDFKVSAKCNSGIFFRLANLKDPVQTGFEMQVYDSAGREKPGKHDCGAVYDALPPSKNAMLPAGEWNHVEIRAEGSLIAIDLNGQRIIDMDLDQWSEPGKNPDGSGNKFKAALKDFARAGHFAFQDHGQPVWYRNIRVKALP